MSRSSSASSLADDRVVGYRPLAGRGKRYLDDDWHVSSRLGDSPSQPCKRPRSSRYHPSAVPAFFVIREAVSPRWDASECASFDAGQPPRAWPPLADEFDSALLASRFERNTSDLLQPPAMERTSSGLSITLDDGAYESPGHDLEATDDTAADKVERHYAKHRRRGRDTKTERVLRSLINPKSRAADFDLDNEALESIFYAVNEIFFYGCLKGRVRWDWSDAFDTRYHSRIVGTTALREAVEGGYETLIVLSQHYLQDKRYNRRLLISTFIHELVHSYLFVQCGFKARRSGGHTEGFHRIARLIDEWAGPHTLFLGNIEADLDSFRHDGDDLVRGDDCGSHSNSSHNHGDCGMRHHGHYGQTELSLPFAFHTFAEGESGLCDRLGSSPFGYASREAPIMF